MNITLHNIENYTYLFDNNNTFNNIDWVAPIFAAMLSAYQKDKSIEIISDNSYLKNMLNSPYKQNKTYTPIEQIISRNEIDKIAAHLTAIMLKNFSFLEEDDRRDLKYYLHYLFSELMNNVADHAYSPVGGFAMAQYYPNGKKIQFAIADRGIGFLENLKLKFDISSENDAIIKALEKGVTASKPKVYGQEKNAGFGLFAMKTILEETGGVFVIISNDVLYRYSKHKQPEIIKLKNPWKGAVISFEFYESKINYTMEDFKKMFLWNNTDEAFF